MSHAETRPHCLRSDLCLYDPLVVFVILLNSIPRTAPMTPARIALVASDGTHLPSPKASIIDPNMIDQIPNIRVPFERFIVVSG
jgi:hypothetical protein